MFIYLKHNLFIYMLIILLFFIMNSSNIFIQWLMMEFSTIISVSLINIKSSNKIPSLIYYVISVISGVFLFLLIMLYFSSINFLKNYEFNFLIQLMFFAKMGIFPFHYWMIYSYEMMNWNQIFLMSTLIKFTPIYMLIVMTYMNNWSILYLLLSSLFISMYTNKFYSLKKMLSCSTIFNSMYFILLLSINKMLFLIFILIYMINYHLLINFLKKFNINNLNFSMISKYEYYMFLILIFNYSMYPFFLTFIIKWMFIFSMTYNYLFNWILFLILISSMVMIWNYFIMLKNNFMMMNFYKNEFNNLKMKYTQINLMILSLFMMNIFIFLIINFLI
uniref:NADH dehydrogenase subunit 2 n=1 Tax=Apis dorsata TaxID=7462 RepID=A0A387IGJ4_APIDO|nr:NADH dehydrogenase subunit 2 [Apis dorsata]